ncbi:MAG: flagellar basal-body rod protein FlgG [Myxococcota bacterium]|jgi:flagellar basal-body rod protein FlgG|nr:flagellar basal-body rod protein FlgG [Myxococcota bacterium]
MIRALNNAAAGMKAQEMNIDVLSNNLANVNTSGFKRARAEFADMFYTARVQAGAPSASGSPLPVGTELGHGVRAVATYKDFKDGETRQTGNPLDIAVNGRGFFQVLQPSGEIAFTRAGVFKSNSEGQLVNSDGYTVEPQISIPADATSVTVSEGGVVSVTLGDDGNQVEVGQLQIATFANPAGLSSIGQNLLKETPASGQAMLSVPGENGAGRLLQGFLETSNVSVVAEMIDLISAQRAYEINAKVVTASDEMLKASTRLG